MRLTELLLRLPPEDYQVLLARHGLPEGKVRSNDHLASLLAEPTHLLRTIGRVNACQLQVLRWLCREPNGEATYSRLLSAIGDRCPRRYVADQLSDLRRWGLVDWDEAKDWVGTFAAVIDTTPQPVGVTLAHHLRQMPMQRLREALRALGAPVAGTKEGMADALLDIATQPTYVRDRVAHLSGEGRAVLQWVVARGGSVDHVTYAQREHYGGPASRYGYPTTVDAELERSLLLVTVSPYPNSLWGASHVIPHELHAAMGVPSLFDATPLMPPRLGETPAQLASEPDPLELCRNIGHLAGFCASGLCEWTKDNNLPYRRNLQALGKLLGAAPDSYVDLLWALATRGALLEEQDRGWKALPVADASPARLYRALATAWVASRHTLYNFQPSDVQADARAAVLSLVGTLPPGVWVPRSSVEAFLHFALPLVFAHSAADLGDYWTEAQHLFLAVGVTPDGDAAVMVPQAVQDLLRNDAAPAGDLQAWDDLCAVQSDRTILAAPNAHPHLLRDLWAVADLEANQGAPIFRISTQSVVRALQQGLDGAAVERKLTAHARTPLPATVLRLIQDQTQRAGRLNVGFALAYLTLDDPALFDELRTHPKLKALNLHRVTPDVAVVLNMDERAVMAALRKAGYLPALDRSSVPAAGDRGMLYYKAGRGNE